MNALCCFEAARSVFGKDKERTVSGGCLAAGRTRIQASRIIVTAKGTDSDFVSRLFAPRIGIPEDPVTGATHCSLIPYWAERLGKENLYARQLSKRGGELFCKLDGERVKIGGNAALYLKGEIYV